MMEKLDVYYPLILIITLTTTFVVLGLWFIFKFLKKIDGSPRLVKEKEIPTDKKFVDYLIEESLSEDPKYIPQFNEKFEVYQEDVKEVSNEKDSSGENEVLKLARKYNVVQGEVELLLNLRSRIKKENNYNKILEEIEKGADIKKVAKKHKVGCGEILVILSLKNKERRSLWQTKME
ncbi:MAG: hypothetical protein N2252_04510 [Candidatus Kryptonium sp.]|nr:hypothetical protein [Candidatus Kryptonium sp.]MCX7762087.1 hypothetical protein [Candidatus Kryptonium sp.]